MIRFLFLSCCVLMPMGLSCPASAAEPPVDFNRDVRRLLSERCFRCHGPDAKTREAGLRLDRPDSATSELDSGETAIVSGKPQQSALIARVGTTDEDLRMPPVEMGPRLSDAEIELLTAWIRQGASYDQHWSMKPVTRPNIAGSTTESGIDTWVDRKLREQNLRPNPIADRRTLVRRITLALTGLPPTPDQVRDFVEDPDPDAYEQFVDQLLASPRFGERWARVWLDIARYADSAGYAQDPPRTIWRYRDWVIDAYNTNKTFDQFTVEQIAGDLLPNPTDDQLLATAFHRNTMTNSEGGTDDEEFRTAAIVDRVNTTMQVWMGLTMACAHCHDHKYDDISQEEYFQVFAILNNTADADRGDEEPLLEELTENQRQQKQQLQAELENLKTAPDTQEKLAERRQELEKQRNEIRGVRTPIMRELPADQRRETHVHVRGNFRVKDKQVLPGVPAVFHELEVNADRLSFAHWLVDQDNPLTARVIVNRYWELLFGKGLVATSEDFGMQGDLPTHPQLLDYLAAELMRHGWDTKWLIREMVLSATYRRSSQVTPELAEHDSENRWLARGPRFRLPAEMIRDQALAISGLLSSKMLGPSVQPPRPNLGLRAAFGGSTDWQPSTGEDRYRRGLYTSWRRTTPYPSMTTFDAPSREFCTIRRIRTNTPLQALVTLNDPVFIEAAQALTRQILSHAEPWDDRLDLAFERVLARPAQAAERASLRQLYDQTLAGFQADEAAAKAMAFDPLSPTAPTAPTAPTDDFDVVQLATWTVLSNVLLNLDETLAPR